MTDTLAALKARWEEISEKDKREMPTACVVLFHRMWAVAEGLERENEVLGGGPGPSVIVTADHVILQGFHFVKTDHARALQEAKDWAIRRLSPPENPHFMPAPAAPREPSPDAEVWWLIERSSTPTPIWWTGGPDWDGATPLYPWTSDPNRAKRFVSRAAAEEQIDAKSGIKGVHEPYGKATEHVWLWRGDEESYVGYQERADHPTHEGPPGLCSGCSVRVIELETRLAATQQRLDALLAVSPQGIEAALLRDARESLRNLRDPELSGHLSIHERAIAVERRIETVLAGAGEGGR